MGTMNYRGVPFQESGSGNKLWIRKLRHRPVSLPFRYHGRNTFVVSGERVKEAKEADDASGPDFDEDGLRVVFDSGPTDETKRIRQEWKDKPLTERIRWTQTTTDVLVWITVPKGTKVKQLTVVVDPCRLCMRLTWFGRVIDGPLHRRCKSSEAIWVLEDEEVHFILPKDDQHYWKSLFVGGSEKSFMEIIQESVDSDEPPMRYDDIDERSKELIEDIKERQQMVHDGFIDLEGFDDFRIVVGETSL